MDIFHSEFADKWRRMLDKELHSLTVEEALDWWGMECFDYETEEG
jgi:hypothetical protein